MKTYKTYILLLFLTSCLTKADYIKPEGYPFIGDIHVLNYRYPKCSIFGYNYNTSKLSHYVYNTKTKVINNQKFCDSFVQLDDSTCNCNDINFSNEILVHKTAEPRSVYYGKYETRVIINHKDKSISVITEIKYVTGSSGYNGSYYYVTYDKWLVIPKPPIGYILKDTLL